MVKCEVLVAQLCLTVFNPMTVVHQAPLSLGAPDKNTGVGCHFLLQRDLPNPGVKPRSPAWQADPLPSELP